MDSRSDIDDAKFLLQYAEARDKGVSINPAPELLRRASDALAARGALGLSVRDHNAALGYERDAARLALMAGELRLRAGSDPTVAASCDALDRAARLCAKVARSYEALVAASAAEAA